MSAAEKDSLTTRLGDRVNPILIREVHQALNGRGFLVTAGLALLSIVVIALIVAAEDDISPREGEFFFTSTLMALVPILFFIVPFQAFLSMRAEVGGGTVEHLLMSRLTPGAIVRGKLIAATVQFVVYMAIFSPLIAMTFLLRGVDVPTIVVMLTLAFILALGSSAVAVACGALCRWKSFFKVIPFGIVLLGLGWVTGGSMVILEDIVRETRSALAEEDTLHWMSMMLTPVLVGVILCALIGASALAHPYANRSTAFRVFALLGLLISLGMALYNYDHQAARSLRYYLDLGAQLSTAITLTAVCLCLFPFFAATEAPRLTPRVANSVPRNPLLAFLVAPLLPGAGRGMVFTLLLTTLALTALYVLPNWWDGDPATAEAWRVTTATWLYVIIFAGVAGFVRNLLGPQPNRNWFARGVLPAMLFLGVILPLIFSAVGGRGPVRSWSVLYIFNPFYTLSRVVRWRMEGEIMVWLWGLAVLAVLLNVVPMVRGVLEVLAAAKARRGRAA